jgi:hypothetical protein
MTKKITTSTSLQELSGVGDNLTPQALARINAERMKARRQLEEKLRQFFESMKEKGEEKLGRNPRSEDLVPYFREYAAHWLKAEAQEWGAQTPLRNEMILPWLGGAMSRIVHQICTREGVWVRAVLIAGQAANFGSSTTRFGTYTPQKLTKPKPEQLKALMVIDARDIQAELVRKAAGVEAGASTGVGKSDRDQLKKYPGRAAWLYEQLRIRAWSPQVLREHKGPDRKTTGRILHGLPVRFMTLEKLADSLSAKVKVTSIEIPND